MKMAIFTFPVWVFTAALQARAHAILIRIPAFLKSAECMVRLLDPWMKQVLISIWDPLAVIVPAQLQRLYALYMNATHIISTENSLIAGTDQ